MQPSSGTRPRIDSGPAVPCRAAAVRRLCCGGTIDDGHGARREERYARPTDTRRTAPRNGSGRGCAARRQWRAGPGSGMSAAPGRDRRHLQPPAWRPPRTTSPTPAPTSTASTCSARRPSASTSPSRSRPSCGAPSPVSSRSTRQIVDAVAHGVKEWALAHGATHLHALVRAHDRLHRREARLVPDPVRRRADDRRVLRQEPRSRASPTRPPSRAAASGPPSRHAATPPGTSPRRSSCRSSPTA